MRGAHLMAQWEGRGQGEEEETAATAWSWLINAL